MNWDFYEDTLVRLFESAIDREIEALQQEQERETTMRNTNSTTETTAPKFKVGDRVQTRNTGYRGEIQAVRTEYTIFWDDGGTTQTTNEHSIEYAKLSEEDAWLEVALMVSKCVTVEYHIGYETIADWRAREIRHSAYQILGGNGIKVTEEVKARVRALIERAKRV